MENMKPTHSLLMKSSCLQIAMLIGFSTVFWGRNSCMPAKWNRPCNREDVTWRFVSGMREFSSYPQKTIPLLKKTIQPTNRCVVCGIQRNTETLSVKTAQLFCVKADCVQLRLCLEVKCIYRPCLCAFECFLPLTGEKLPLTWRFASAEVQRIHNLLNARVMCNVLPHEPPLTWRIASA